MEKQGTLKAGDCVTADSWDGDTAVIEKITDYSPVLIYGPIAFFVGGGFWRVSQLRKVEG